MWIGPNSPLSLKLVAFGEVAFIKVGKGSTHTSMNERSSRFDDDGDLVVVAVAQPVEGHMGSLINLALHPKQQVVCRITPQQ